MGDVPYGDQFSSFTDKNNCLPFQVMYLLDLFSSVVGKIDRLPFGISTYGL